MYKIAIRKRINTETRPGHSAKFCTTILITKQGVRERMFVVNEMNEAGERVSFDKLLDQHDIWDRVAFILEGDMQEARESLLPVPLGTRICEIRRRQHNSHILTSNIIGKVDTRTLRSRGK
jgi:hypothetical protein